MKQSSEMERLAMFAQGVRDAADYAGKVLGLTQGEFRELVVRVQAAQPDDRIGCGVLTPSELVGLVVFIRAADRMRRVLGMPPEGFLRVVDVVWPAHEQERGEPRFEEAAHA